MFTLDLPRIIMITILRQRLFLYIMYYDVIFYINEIIIYLIEKKTIKNNNYKNYIEYNNNPLLFFHWFCYHSIVF